MRNGGEMQGGQGRRDGRDYLKIVVAPSSNLGGKVDIDEN